MYRNWYFFFGLCANKSIYDRVIQWNIPSKKSLFSHSYVVSVCRDSLGFFFARVGILNSGFGGSREVLVSVSEFVCFIFFCREFSCGHIYCEDFSGHRYGHRMLSRKLEDIIYLIYKSQTPTIKIADSIEFSFWSLSAETPCILLRVSEANQVHIAWQI